MKNNTNTILLPLLLMLFLGLGVLMGGMLNRESAPEAVTNSDGSKLQNIIQLLQDQYVDSVQSEKLFDQTINDMLHKLDPHSNYIPAEDIKLANEQIEGKFGGVGIRFAIIRDTLSVTNVVEGSPSQLAGIFAGDRILKIDNKKVANKKIQNDTVMGMLKGDPNTEVTVQILRGKKKMTKRIMRDVITLQSIVCAEMLTKDVGYIRLDNFSLSSADEFHSAAQSLLGKGMKKLIFDLRDNGGGVLDGAIRISDEFLPVGREIVEVKGTHQKRQISLATAGGLLEKTPTVVLINENSASASEIVSGALQDNDQATIVGRRSFGKGLVQQDFTLRDKSNVRLTIARYYTPSGRCIQRAFDGNYEDYYNDDADRQKSGEYFAPDTTLFKKSERYKTLKGRTVYGGGGIMPDYFVPLDTSNSSMYYISLRYSPVFQHVAFDFVAKKRGTWKSIQAFNAGFNVSDALLSMLTKYAEDEFDIPVQTKELNRSRDLIKRALKAEIARQLFIEEGYFYVQTAGDKEIQKAISVLK